MSLAKASILLWFGIVIGLANGQAKRLTEQTVPPDTLITLRRPDCFLTCPDYLLTIAADGTLTYEGYSNVKVKGKVVTKIGRDKVAILIAAFEKAKYFSLRDQYIWQEDGCQKVWPDSSSATTSILINGKSKTVEHYRGCHRKGRTSYPEALSKLEDLIDDIANTGQWID